MLKRVIFQHKLLPYLLVAPQLAVTIIFFVWPAAQALQQSVFIEGAFGGNAELSGSRISNRSSPTRTIWRRSSARFFSAFR